MLIEAVAPGAGAEEPVVPAGTVAVTAARAHVGADPSNSVPVRVEVAESGAPVRIDIDPSMVGPGRHEELSRKILEACRRAALKALARQGGELAAAGIGDNALARLRLPQDVGEAGSGDAGAVGTAPVTAPSSSTSSTALEIPAVASDTRGGGSSWLIMA